MTSFLMSSGLGMPQIYLSLDASYLQMDVGQEHVKCLSLLSELLQSQEGDNQNELVESESQPVSAAVEHSIDDLRAGSFQYMTASGMNLDQSFSLLTFLCFALRYLTLSPFPPLPLSPLLPLLSSLHLFSLLSTSSTPITPCPLLHVFLFFIPFSPLHFNVCCFPFLNLCSSYSSGNFSPLTEFILLPRWGGPASPGPLSDSVLCWLQWEAPNNDVEVPWTASFVSGRTRPSPFYNASSC